jgi:hypothetical protein
MSTIANLLAQYPQYATPTGDTGFGFRLRQKIVITRFEVRIIIVGAQSNVLLSADLYNTVRVSLIKSGPNYSTANINYLTSVLAHGVLADTREVFVDRTFPLPTQAFNTANSYNIPQVLEETFAFNTRCVLNWYSTNSAGSSWDTEAYDIKLELVSDSSATPHPQVSVAVRMFYSWIRE